MDGDLLPGARDVRFRSFAAPSVPREIPNAPGPRSPINLDNSGSPNMSISRKPPLGQSPPQQTLSQSPGTAGGPIRPIGTSPSLTVSIPPQGAAAANLGVAGSANPGFFNKGPLRSHSRPQGSQGSLVTPSSAFSAPNTGNLSSTTKSLSSANTIPSPTSPKHPEMPMSPMTPASPRVGMNFPACYGNNIPDIKAVQGWTVHKVAEWLRCNQFSKYEKIFIENDINGKILLEIDHEILREMEINSVGERMKLMKLAKELKRLSSNAPKNPDEGGLERSQTINVTNSSSSTINLLSANSTAPTSAISGGHTWASPGVSSHDIVDPILGIVSSPVGGNVTPGDTLSLDTSTSSSGLNTDGVTPDRSDPLNMSSGSGNLSLHPTSAAAQVALGSVASNFTPTSANFGDDAIPHRERAWTTIFNGRNGGASGGTAGFSGSIPQTPNLPLPPAPIHERSYSFDRSKSFDRGRSGSLTAARRNFIQENSLPSMGTSPAISPLDENMNYAKDSANNDDIMAYEVVKKQCIRVVGQDGQSRIVNVQGLREMVAIISRVLDKFNIKENPESYRLYASTGADATATSQPKLLDRGELISICEDATRPERMRLFLRKVKDAKTSPKGTRGKGSIGRKGIPQEFYGANTSSPSADTALVDLFRRKDSSMSTNASQPSTTTANSDNMNQTIRNQQTPSSKLQLSKFESFFEGRNNAGTIKAPAPTISVTVPQQEVTPPINPRDSALMSPANMSRQKKLASFFGQRPPSEMITTNLERFFPGQRRQSNRRSRAIRRTSDDDGGSENNGSGELGQSYASGSVLGTSVSRKRSSIARSMGSGSFLDAPPPLPSGATGPTFVMGAGIRGSEYLSMVIEDPDFGKLSTSEPNLEQAIPSVGSEHHIGSVPSGHMDSFEDFTSKVIDDYTAVSDSRATSTKSLAATEEPAVVPEMNPVDEVEDDDDEVEDEEMEDEEEEEEDEEEEEEDDEEDDEEEEEEEDADKARVRVESLYYPGALGDEVKKEFKWMKGRLIGKGSFGSVYLGLNAATGELMAAKQVELPTLETPEMQQRKEQMVDALQQEISLLKNLNHNNIVRYLGSSSNNKHLNIFLEYVPGGSVAALLATYGAFEEPLVKTFCKQIMEGLNYLHEKDIIHRDIKGGNILVDNKGCVKISDFGLSMKLNVDSDKNKESLKGSIFWMAPEVVKAHQYSMKSDIWSVGCLVIEMFTGDHPWPDCNQMQAIFKIGTNLAPSFPSTLSVNAKEFLSKSLCINVQDRPSAKELLATAFVIAE